MHIFSGFCDSFPFELQAAILDLLTALFEGDKGDLKLLPERVLEEAPSKDDLLAECSWFFVNPVSSWPEKLAENEARPKSTSAYLQKTV